MTEKHVSGPSDDEVREPAPRAVTYHQASSAFTVVTARKRYDELSERELCARGVGKLRERGEFDPDNLGHRVMAEHEPLTAADHLEMMAAGEVLARYYRHPAMLDHAAKAGATWEQIGAARGTSAEEARADYREWARGQHDLLSYKDGQFGMSDDEYAAALARSANPETHPGGIGDPEPHRQPQRRPDQGRQPGRARGGLVMALTITQKVMRSTETAHTAKLAHDRAGVPFVIPGDGGAEAEGAWRVSWLPGQLLDRDGAVAAMTLADLVSEGNGMGLSDDPRWPEVDALAAELGLSGPDAVVRASEPPPEREAGQ